MQQYLYFFYSFICSDNVPLSQLVLILKGIRRYTIYFACREEQFVQRSANERNRNARIPTHENLLTSVPTQNVDSAELTDIKQILNVLLKKK